MSKIRVEKTSNLNGQKLWRLSRKFMVPPIIIRDLQKGHVEEIEEHAAKAMIAANVVKRVAETKTEVAEPKQEKDKKSKSKKAKAAIEATGSVDNIKTVVDEPESDVVVEDDFIGDTEDDTDDDEDILDKEGIEL